MTADQQRKLYAKMRREAERLLVLKRWLGEQGGHGSTVWQAVDAQMAATLRTCGTLTGPFTFSEMKRHRAWLEGCRLF